MGQEYRRIATTVSLINYHFVFCPRYRRKVLVHQVEERFKELGLESCAENDWRMIAMEVMPDHVHVFLNTLPAHSPAKPSSDTLKNKRQEGDTMQTITLQIRIVPDNPSVLANMGNEYIRTVNELTKQAEASGTFPKLTSKTVHAKLPSAVKNQLIRDARSIFQKSKKEKKRPVLKKRVYYVNNQNYSIGDNHVSFPVVMDGKVQRLVVSALIAQRDRELLSTSKRGLLRVVQKTKKTVCDPQAGDKESRYMKDQNHKVSRQIVNMAIQEKVSIIKLEKLADIRKTTRTSRKNAKNLHSWSFYQLQMFIRYKAALAGIKVIEVHPAYTSQTCPSCGQANKAKDRVYQCDCGYTAHRDRVGAINIMRQPVADGNSLSA